MIQAERHEQTTWRKSHSKHWLSFLKICLAIAILIVILANVKINDHLIIPDGSPCAGIHVGRIIDQSPAAGSEKKEFTFQERRWFFLPVSESTFYFSAIRENEKILTATVRQQDESVYTYTSEESAQMEIREGLISVLKKVKLSLWLISNAIYFFAIGLTVWRWRLLLIAVDLPQKLFRAFRLVYIGIFFNNIVPGQTGGDWVRGYYIAKENKGRRTDAILTVIVDRGLGIVALACIAAWIIPTDFERYGACTAPIYGLIGFVMLGSMLYFSKRLRKFFKLDVLIKSLPFHEFFQKIDGSIFLYRYRKYNVIVCFLLSILIHGIIITSVWVLGNGLGIDLSLFAYMAFIPIIFIISSLPLTPSGWGVGELAFVFFLGTAGVAPVQAMALSLVFRVNASLQSILGGIFLLMEKDRFKPGNADFEDKNPENKVKS
ncbi:MAG: lysylphosphatidylglycerol synthase transmembrane domain-containing protein [Planctomycetota bacterium]